ncbi:hypothetical protein PT974_03634 [Cladobotryum mycophilum]|uniref:Uncharacterized protein n=1 Tax=Cladobotryum mycophilum TaxID=491253 RepID=A0ABR0STY8_9HYPO
MPEGRESPSPERLTGAQQRDPPASGQGTDKIENKEQKLKDEIANLESNPKGPMEDVVKAKFAKGPGNCKQKTLGAQLKYSN